MSRNNDNLFRARPESVREFIIPLLWFLQRHDSSSSLETPMYARYCRTIQFPHRPEFGNIFTDYIHQSTGLSSPTHTHLALQSLSADGKFDIFVPHGKPALEADCLWSIMAEVHSYSRHRTISSTPNKNMRLGGKFPLPS